VASVGFSMADVWGDDVITNGMVQLVLVVCKVLFMYAFVRRLH